MILPTTILLYCTKVWTLSGVVSQKINLTKFPVGADRETECVSHTESFTTQGNTHTVLSEWWVNSDKALQRGHSQTMQ